MNRAAVFAIVVAGSVIGLAASFYLYIVTYSAPLATQSMVDMMSRMMGTANPMAQTGSVSPPYLMSLPLVFLPILIVGVVGLAYFLAVPEIRLSSAIIQPERKSSVVLQQDRYSTLIKTMKPDEAKVLNVIVSHGGKYLQKHVSKEAELSRLRTHRIIARFAERGIVNVRPLGNTNEVALSDWLVPEKNLEKR
ncbi:MAG: hypothetical protein HY619_07640 [Thaumarchaeota archaeon]|nr:hypothetical protein [Nitrososphaerota archaeon]